MSTCCYIQHKWLFIICAVFFFLAGSSIPALSSEIKSSTDQSLAAPAYNETVTDDRELNGTNNVSPESKGEATPVSDPNQTAQEDNEAKRETSGESGHEADVSALKKKEDKELKHILVLLTELSADGMSHTFAPVFLTEHRNIGGTITDLAFSWVGYKLSLTFKQRNFPVKNVSFEETLIGSFLYASGTNLGFIGGRYREETRFYTNYISEIFIVRWKALKYLTIGAGLGSRQYFFIKDNIPSDFIMPKDHFNVFPRIILDIGDIKEKGIDSLTHGVQLASWAGYGYRSTWERWGSPDDLQMGEKAQDFFIFSSTFTGGILFLEDLEYFNNQNIIFKIKFKGGIDNDFLSGPRFGGTIDNAKLDLVHGFTLDEFRVDDFLLINFSYGFDIIERLRFTVFFDYSHVILPYARNIIGAGYNFRVKAFFGIPIWFSHGIGKELGPYEKRLRNTFMLMAAAGW